MPSPAQLMASGDLLPKSFDLSICFSLCLLAAEAELLSDHSGAEGCASFLHWFDGRLDTLQLSFEHLSHYQPVT